MKRSSIVSAVVAVAATLVPISVLAAPGDLYVTDFGSNTIFKFAHDGTRTTFATGLFAPAGLAFDGSGNLFVSNEGTSTIIKFAPDGTRSTFASGLSDPIGLAFDSAGNLFVADPPTIQKITPTGTSSTFASGLNPYSLAFDRAGNLFVGEPASSTIYQIHANWNQEHLCLRNQRFRPGV